MKGRKEYDRGNVKYALHIHFIEPNLLSQCLPSGILINHGISKRFAIHILSVNQGL